MSTKIYLVVQNVTWDVQMIWITIEITMKLCKSTPAVGKSTLYYRNKLSIYITYSRYIIGSIYFQPFIVNDFPGFLFPLNPSEIMHYLHNTGSLKAKQLLNYTSKYYMLQVTGNFILQPELMFISYITFQK